MISSIVLSHNDENVIAKTIQSLKWCDEIILLDDYSSDKTCEIAKKHAGSVFQRHVDGDFASQRNFGLSKAKYDWVLFVDSDEIVTEDLHKEITKAIQGESVGYYLKRVDYMWGKAFKYGETGSVRLLRLAKKDAGKWERPVHEVWNVNGNTGVLDNPILHYPHPTVAQFLEEINIYSTLNADYLYTQNVHVSVWQIIGYPVAKFFRNYLLHAGFLDGTRGVILALMMSFHSFLTRAKLYQLWRKV
jgi:glycosyltransferase involved in cell wall biosynthesis